jgi:hypothetical protein
MGIGAALLFGIWVWIFIVSIPCLAGSIMLLRHNHTGVFFALFGLGLMAISLPFATAIYFGNGQEGVGFLLLLISLAITISMFPILIVGSKRTEW